MERAVDEVLKHRYVDLRGKWKLRKSRCAVELWCEWAASRHYFVQALVQYCN